MFGHVLQIRNLHAHERPYPNNELKDVWRASLKLIYKYVKELNLDDYNPE